MFATYTRKKEGNQIRLTFEEEISLAGCNKGIIPKLLKEKLSKDDRPPLAWTLPIARYYNNFDQTVIIDIKPNSKDETVFCELDAVFGFSHEEWSPVMFRLRQLFNAYTEDLRIDKENFIYPSDTEIIYTLSYLTGSFHNGDLIGKWVYPGSSSTNSVLLWSDAISFFNKQIEKFDPGFLDRSYKCIISQR